MDSNTVWQKFILSGRVEDYLKYVDSCRHDILSGGDKNAFFNGRACHKGEEHRGK